MRIKKLKTNPTFNFKEFCDNKSTQTITNLERMKCLMFRIHKIYYGDFPSKGGGLNICSLCNLRTPTQVLLFSPSQFRILWTKQTIQKAPLGKGASEGVWCGPEKQANWPTVQPTQCYRKPESLGAYISHYIKTIF